MNLESKKYNIIEKIMSIADEKLIDQINKKISNLMLPKKQANEAINPVDKYRTTIEKDFDLEKIKTSQNYQGIDIEKMNMLIEQADIQEELEELLKMI